MLCSISHLLEEEAVEKLTRLEDEYQKTEEDMMTYNKFRKLIS